MRLLKLAATAIIAVAASALLWRYVAIPYRCNLRLRTATHDVLALFEAPPNDLRAAPIARRTIQEMELCAARCPGNIGVQMALAASYRALGFNRPASEAYETALRYDRRPELYFNLGQTQLAIGDSKGALQNLVLACIYNPAYIDEISRYHPEVQNAISEYQVHLMQQKN